MERKGYINAVHVFGKSMLARLGQTCHLQWQWRKDSRPTTSPMILLTKKQYDSIKKLLGPIIKRDQDIGTHTSSIKIYHESNSKHYMRVKRYLKKEGLL